MDKSNLNAAKKNLVLLRGQLKTFEEKLKSTDDKEIEKAIVSLHILNLFSETELNKGVEILLYSCKQ